jgi:hypothetical protein
MRFWLRQISWVLSVVLCGCVGEMGSRDNKTCSPACQTGQHCDTASSTCVCDNPCTAAGSICDPAGSGRISTCSQDATTGCYSMTDLVACPISGQTCAVGAGACATPGASLQIATTSLPDGMVTRSYSQILAASGGTTPYTWAISSGTLPAGLTLTGGVIAGTPTTAATSNFTVQVTDAASTVQTKAMSIRIAGNLVIGTTSLPGGMVSTVYSQTLAATGGLTPYTWSISMGSLPNGLSISAAGVIGGTPTAAGTSNVTVRVVDTDGFTASKALSIAVTATLTITTSSPLPNGTYGTAYSTTLAASSGTTPYTWLLIGGALPGGLSLNVTTGEISGTPTATGTFSFTIMVTDAASVTVSKLFSLTIPHYVTLTWTAPETNTDTSALTDLAGYRLYVSATSGSYGSGTDLGLLGCTVGTTCTYNVTGLASGTWYFVVTAYNADLSQSAFSNQTIATVP